jgi:hypothetical protein
VAKARKKPAARQALHPFTFDPSVYPGEAVGTPPVPLPEQQPQQTQGGAEAGRFFNESELPVQAVGAYPARIGGKEVRADSTPGKAKAQARVAKRARGGKKKAATKRRARKAKK